MASLHASPFVFRKQKEETEIRPSDLDLSVKADITAFTKCHICQDYPLLSALLYRLAKYMQEIVCLRTLVVLLVHKISLGKDNLVMTEVET